MLKEYLHPVTGERIVCEHLALFDEYLFRIFCFLDGSYFKTNTPGSGPNGDYEGATRKNNWYIMQRAVYNRYKRLHGIHILSLLLPNGINYIYGPNSARGGDASAMMHSQLNEFLEELQRGLFVDANGNEIFFVTHGDMLFAPNTCISRNHRPTANAPLNAMQKAENAAINTARISIEHSYGIVQNKFSIIGQPNEFKLNQADPHAKELLSAVMLYSNISTCLNGSQVGGLGFFQCLPPRLEDYLQL